MWKRLSSKILLKHPRLTVAEDQVQLPGGQVVPYLRFDGSHRGVTVMCVQDGKILIQQEYSYPPNEVLWEFPGGGVMEYEDPKEAAKRELIEECGLLAHDLTELGWYYLNNRRSAHKMFVYVTTKVTECEKGGGDIEENPRQTWMTVDNFRALIANGEITNYSVLAAWALWQNQRNFL